MKREYHEMMCVGMCCAVGFTIAGAFSAEIGLLVVTAACWVVAFVSAFVSLVLAVKPE